MTCVHSHGQGLGIYKAHGNEEKERTKAQNSEGTRYAEGDASPSVWQDYSKQAKKLILERQVDDKLKQKLRVR